VRLFKRANRRSDYVRRKKNLESQEVVNRASKKVQETSGLGASIDQSYNGEGTTFSENLKLKTKLRIGWRPASLVICTLLAYTLTNAWNSPQFRIEEIEIIGSQRISETDILAAIPAIGQHSYALDLESLKNDLLRKFPEFRQVEVKLGMPAQLNIHVVERQPVFSWKHQGTTYWIDDEGYLIPARGKSSVTLTILADSIPAYIMQRDLSIFNIKKSYQDKPAFHPGISDLAFFSSPKRIDMGLLSAILQLNAWMPEERNLLYQKTRGLGWKDPRGWDVFVGQKLEKINERMVMYQMLIRNLEDQDIYPTMVSVEFLHAPYYRLDE